VTAPEGASRNSIVEVLPGVVGRAVLIDVARHRGVDWMLVKDEPIRPAEFDAVLAAQGVELRTADIVLIRTGWRRKAIVEGWSPEWIETNPGLHPDCTAWLDDNEVMAVCSDNHSIDAVPMVEPDTFYPLHVLVIRDLGMMMGEIWDLEELAADSAADGRWESFLVAPPLRVAGGVGSPVSPIAIK
jgi:kynurenine formamidase